MNIRPLRFPCSVAVQLIVCAAIFNASAQPATNSAASLPIDLPTALRLAGAQNLDVQLARAKLREAQAAHDAALYQFFPWISPGFAYRRHDGNIQDVSGTVFDAHKQQYALGANLQARLEIGDTWFKALASKQLAQAAGHAAEAQRQESAFAAALGYFDLVKARAIAAIAQDSARIAQDYADQLQRGVDLGLFFKGDALRARGQAERNQLNVQQAGEQQRLAAARLSQVLRLDPTVDLSPADLDPLPLQLADTNAALASLVFQALTTRPELLQGKALTESARKDRDATTIGPLIPSLGAQAYFGGLGGGQGGSTGNFGDTENLSLTIDWRLLGPGSIFDSSRKAAGEARLSSAGIMEMKLKDEVILQVVASNTRVRSLAAQLAILKRALATAEESFQLTRERKERGVSVVLENILSEQELTRSRTDHLACIVEFNKAQYALMRAVGSFAVAPAGKR